MNFGGTTYKHQQHINFQPVAGLIDTIELNGTIWNIGRLSDHLLN